MKMNDLDAVHDIVDMSQSMADSASGSTKFQLQKHLPPNRLKGKMINGRDVIDLGDEGKEVE